MLVEGESRGVSGASSGRRRGHQSGGLRPEVLQCLQFFKAKVRGCDIAHLVPPDLGPSGALSSSPTCSSRKRRAPSLDRPGDVAKERGRRVRDDEVDRQMDVNPGGHCRLFCAGRDRPGRPRSLFSHPALVALAIALFALSGAALFGGGSGRRGRRLSLVIRDVEHRAASGSNGVGSMNLEIRRASRAGMNEASHQAAQQRDLCART